MGGPSQLSELGHVSLLLQTNAQYQQVKGRVLSVKRGRGWIIYFVVISPLPTRRLKRLRRVPCVYSTSQNLKLSRGSDHPNYTSAPQLTTAKSVLPAYDSHSRTVYGINRPSASCDSTAFQQRATPLHGLGHLLKSVTSHQSNYSSCRAARCLHMSTRRKGTMCQFRKWFGESPVRMLQIGKMYVSSIPLSRCRLGNYSKLHCNVKMLMSVCE